MKLIIILVILLVVSFAAYQEPEERRESPSTLTSVIQDFFMAKSISEIQQKSDEKRGVRSKGYKLPVETIELIEA